MNVVLCTKKVKRAEIMRQLGRHATAAEGAKVQEEVAAIQMESSHLDSVLAVLHAPCTIPLVNHPTCCPLLQDTALVFS